MRDQTRRDVLLASGALATTIAAAAAGRKTLAQNANSIAASPWDYRSIKELTDALQGRKLSSLELVDHAIARIEALDGRLNAVVVRDFEGAREAAKTADAALARGEQRPLLGIPVTIKEFFNIAGLPTTWGDPQFKDFVPKEDAILVSRTKSAGAVILGTTAQARCIVCPGRSGAWPQARSPWSSDGG
jgi:amidase